MKTYTKQQVLDQLEELYLDLQKKISESEKKPVTIAEHSYRNGLLQACVIVTSKMLNL